jgi:hypothetical protein
MMTTRFVKLKFIAVAAVCLACLGTFPAFSQDIGDPVTIEKDRILIPGTNISESDQRAVNAILAKYDKSLYKLKGYVKGKAGKPQGTLNDASIDKATAARAAKHAKDPNFSGWTLQIGSTTNQNTAAKPGSTTNQNAAAKPGNTANQNGAAAKSGSTTNQNGAAAKSGNTANQNGAAAKPGPSPEEGSKARELVKRLRPILQKYSKAQSKR